MDLKELLGDAYKEGMTFDEINTAISAKKIADLSSGAYVNKEAAEAEKRRLEQEKKDLETQLNSKLTDDEKASKIAEEKDKQIQKLLNQIKDNNMSASKSNICSTTSDIRSKIGIANDDESFTKFVNLIALEKSEDNTYISSYLSRIMRAAYDKGTEDAKKDIVGSNNVGGKGEENPGSKKEENYGTRLGKKARENSKAKYNYFE